MSSLKQIVALDSGKILQNHESSWYCIVDASEENNCDERTLGQLSRFE